LKQKSVALKKFNRKGRKVYAKIAKFKIL